MFDHFHLLYYISDFAQLQQFVSDWSIISVTKYLGLSSSMSLKARFYSLKANFWATMSEPNADPQKFVDHILKITVLPGLKASLRTKFLTLLAEIYANNSQIEDAVLIYQKLFHEEMTRLSDEFTYIYHLCQLKRFSEAETFLAEKKSSSSGFLKRLTYQAFVKHQATLAGCSVFSNSPPSSKLLLEAIRLSQVRSSHSVDFSTLSVRLIYVQWTLGEIKPSDIFSSLFAIADTIVRRAEELNYLGNHQILELL